MLLLLPLFVMSCSDDSNNTAAIPGLTSYDFRNMHYYNGVMPGDANRVTLEYLGQRIIKRTGALKLIDQATGYNYFFSNEVSDTLTYNENQIVIEEGRVLPWYPEPQKRTAIILDSWKRMVQKINLTPFPVSIDTTKFTYNSAGLLIKTSKGKSNNYHEISSYDYNSDKNLVSIFTTNYYSATGIAYTIRENFSNYDHAENPVKNLFLFNETFYRSLSRNNYMHYEMVQYDPDNNVMATDNRNWNIAHDSSGNIIF